MKQKVKTYGFVFLAVVLLLAGLAAFLSRNTPGGMDRDFQLNRDFQVIRIDLQDKEYGVSIQKVGSQWKVNEIYQANEPSVLDLIATLRHLFVRFPVPQLSQQQVAAELAQTGILVEVYVQSYWMPFPRRGGLFPRQRKVKGIIVGEDTPDGESTYMMMQDATTPYVVQVPGLAGGLREVFLPMEHLWRDPVLINLQPHQISRVSVSWLQNPRESFVLQHEDNWFDLYVPHDEVSIDPAGLHQERLRSFVQGFTELYYEMLLTGQSLEEHHDLIIPGGFMQLEVVDQEGRPTSLTFFRKKLTQTGALLPAAERNYDPNRFYIQLPGGHFAIGQYYVFNRIMRPLSFFVINPDQ